MATRRHVGTRVEVHEELASTNDRAADAAPGTAVVADRQTAGRGQYGRAWQAPAGSSVLMSLRLDPPADLRRPAVLTALAAVSVADLVAELQPEAVSLKWPNDVLAAGRKVSGILIEQRAGVVVGVGLNLNQTETDFAAAGLSAAASLRTLTGRRFDRDEVAGRLLGRLDAEYARLLAGDRESLQIRWAGRLGLAGKAVTLTGHDGHTVAGTLAQVTFGALTLHAPGGALAFAPEAVRGVTEIA